jgi:hypothetical protein
VPNERQHERVNAKPPREIAQKDREAALRLDVPAS